MVWGEDFPFLGRSGGDNFLGRERTILGPPLRLLLKILYTD